MSRSTTELRRLWDPPCKRLERTHFVDAYRALDACFKAWSYRVLEGETWGYNCRKITGGSGYSLHAYAEDSTFHFWTGVRVAMAVAVDVNSRANPYGPRLVTNMPRPMVEAILAIRTNSGAQVWGWGGNYRNNKDAMHFELVCSPAELRTGIDWRTVRGTPSTPTPQPELEPEDDDMQLIVFAHGVPNSECFVLTPDGKKLIVRDWTTDPNTSILANVKDRRAVLLAVDAKQLAAIPTVGA